MPRKPYRHKLLLDEGLYLKKALPRTNSRHDIKHIKHDLNKGGVSDKKVYSIANKNKRIIVTYNIDDFKKLARESPNSGVIGISQGIPPDQLDKKLSALLSKKTPKSLYGKYAPLSKA
ncbi:MAG: DUF5615 family PIN-like protein [Candidatus Levybacteria bacterium]|nr:DUF5615 family PIN-like protein [Candidatus Levybacteria bacterium]